jgi:hypothetical protein
MKKTLFLTSIALIGLSSCRKSRTCECTAGSGSTSVSEVSYIKDTKRKARKICEGGSGNVGYATVTCVIVK